MADADKTLGGVSPQRITTISELEGAKVRVLPDNKLHVEFRINDLVKKLLPGGIANGPGSSCGGCSGCMGCGH